MGMPSDRRKSALRPGRRERARVKKSRRSLCVSCVGGAIQSHVQAGRKKFAKVLRYVEGLVNAHQSGDPSMVKSEIAIRRPLYRIVIGPPSAANERQEKGKD